MHKMQPRTRGPEKKADGAKTRIVTPRKTSVKSPRTTVKKAAHTVRAKAVSAKPIRSPKIKTANKAQAKDLSWGYLRQNAVKKAWEQERALVTMQLSPKSTNISKFGTGLWDDRQARRIKREGKIKGYQGHHIRSVKGHSKKWAGDPRNIKFVTPKEHLRLHKGDFHKSTTGKLIDRTKMIRTAKKATSKTR